MPDYPAAFDALATDLANHTLSKDVHPSLHNEVNEILVTIEHELGLNPSGAEATVGARIGAIEDALAAIEGSDVDSFNGRVGAVVPVAGDYDVGDIAGLTEALEAKQPSDTDLTKIAALGTTEYGRNLLTLANELAARNAFGLKGGATAELGAAGEAGKILKADDSALIKNVKSFGAKGDGATDDQAAIQAGIDYLDANGGGTLYFPPGTYMVGKKLILKELIILAGAGWVSSIIKLKAGVNDHVIEGDNYAGVGIWDGGTMNICIDGNKAENAGAGAGVKVTGQCMIFEHTIVRETRGDGINLHLGEETRKKISGEDSFFDHCRMIGCAGKGLAVDAKDTTIRDVQTIQCTEYGFKLDANCVMIQCHTWCYASDATCTKVGMYLGGDCSLSNCVAEGASEAQVQLAGGNNRLVGGDIYDSTGKPNVALVEFLAGENYGTHELIGVYLHNFGTGGALKFTGNGANSKINCHIYDPGVEMLAGIGEPSSSIIWDVSFGGTTKRGTIPGHHVRRRRTLTPFAPGDIPNNTEYVDEATGRLKWKDNAGTTRYMVPVVDRLRTVDLWRPEGTKAENMSRLFDAKNLAAVLTSGKLYVVGGLILPADQAINRIHFYSATTGATNPTHQWACLIDVTTRKILSISKNKTNEAWGANSKKTFEIEAAYTPVAEDKPVYVGLLVAAEVVPTLRGREHENNFPSNAAPILSGTSNEGLTVPLAVNEVVNALTATQKVAYVTVN